MLRIKTKRETIVILAGITAVLGLAVYHFLIDPVIVRNRNLHRIFADKQSALTEIRRLEQQVRALKADDLSKSKAHVATAKNFSLFSFLDSQARATGVKEQVVYMKPSESKIEGQNLILSIVKLKLSKVYLKDCMNFIKRIETSQQPVNIYSIALQRSGKTLRTLDVVMEARVVKKN